jgi:DNA-binding transcriptional LysR family regulator
MAHLEQLETFVRVVEAGSFSGAARQMVLAKSAVSRRVAELESRLGAQLLHRTTRRLSMTETGQQLYERAQRILADLEEAEESATGDKALLRGRLHVTAPLSFGVMHLPPLLTPFLERYPDLILDLDLSDRMLNLVESGFDLALRIGDLEDSSIVARRLAPIRFVLCASSDYLRKNGVPEKPQELTGHQGLSYSNAPEGDQWRFESPESERISVRVPSRLRSNNGDILLQQAIAGMGIAVLPTFLAYRAVQSGELRVVLPGYPPPATALYALYPSRRYQPYRVRALIDHLADRLSDPPHWDRILNQEGVAI